MELRQYLALFRKWAWLIALTTIVAAGSSYYYSRTMPPIYQSTTILMVGQLLQNPNPTGGEFQVASQLAQSYALIAKQQPILKAAADAVHWSESLQSLEAEVSTTAVGGQLLQINVMDVDPARAKLIADEMAHQLVSQSPTGQLQTQSDEQRRFVTSQMDQLKLQIETAQKTLSSLNSQAGLENDPNKLKDLNDRMAGIQTQIDNWQKTYASLGALLTSNPSNFLTVITPAVEPTRPISPDILRNTLFAALAGLVLAGGAILLLEYLDDTIKNAEDVQRVLNLATLGAITRIGHIREPHDHLITVKHPRSPISEAYRVLRTNLRFTGLENPSGALLVTSAGPGEGKTTTAANLAVILAQSGRQVVLVDTDLRRPAIHKFFGLSNSMGLSSLFVGDAPTLESIVQRTAIEGLRVVTSGPMPPNPAEVLDSERMNQILASLRSQADTLILDSPPILAVADASILGSQSSGAVMVVDSGHTRSDVCRRAVETLNQTGVQLYGVVLNKLSLRHASSYYHYYYYYSSKDHEDRKNGDRQTE